MIKREEWKTAGNILKDELRECQICRKSFEPNELCARHLSFEEPIEEKHMLIVCKECNYRFHLAEIQEKEKLAALNEQLRADFFAHRNDSEALVLGPIGRKYNADRSEIVAETIISVVETHLVSIRPTLDRYFMYPNIWEGDIIWRLKELGAWNVLAYAPIAKRKRETMIAEEKEMKRLEKNKKKQLHKEKENTSS